jgi:hypothetical protein
VSTLDKMKSMIPKFTAIFAGSVDIALIGNVFRRIRRRAIWPALPYPVPISPNDAGLNFVARDRIKGAERDARLEGGFQLRIFQREAPNACWWVFSKHTFCIGSTAPGNLLIVHRVQAHCQSIH